MQWSDRAEYKSQKWQAHTRHVYGSQEHDLDQDLSDLDPCCQKSPNMAPKSASGAPQLEFLERVQQTKDNEKIRKITEVQVIISNNAWAALKNPQGADLAPPPGQK